MNQDFSLFEAFIKRVVVNEPELPSVARGQAAADVQLPSAARGQAAADVQPTEEADEELDSVASRAGSSTVASREDPFVLTPPAATVFRQVAGLLLPVLGCQYLTASTWLPVLDRQYLAAST